MPDSAPSHEAAYVTARRVVCARSSWSAAFGNRDAELLQRTVYAFVLALNSGTETPVVALPATGQTQPLLWSLHIEPARDLLEHTRFWSIRQPQRPSGQLGELRELIDAGTFPGFSFGDGRGPQGRQLPEDLPLRCAAAMTDEGVEWALSAPREHSDEARLEALLQQATTVLTAVCHDPALSLTDLASAVRAASFDIRVITSTSIADLAASLSAWGTTIGLPLRARRIEPEEAHVAEPSPGILEPQRWGANVAVIAPGLDLPAGPETRLAGISSVELAGRLPDGTPIAELNANETRELIDEIIVRAQYLRAGIQIHDSDVILDVGANIGIFTLFAASQASQLQIHAFEPVPAVADVLETNIRAHGLTARVERAALGRHSGQADFTYYPQSSLQSGLYADPAADEEVVRVYARQQTDGRTAIAAALKDQVAEALAPAIHQRTAQPQTLTVPVRRLSEWVREQDIDRINLLKVDVERAEEDVLLGIDPEHWPLIDQVVVEVHDIASRLERMVALLRANGFHTTVEQDALFAGSEIRMLYARRPNQSRTAKPWVTRQIATAAHWAASSTLPVVVTAVPGTADGDMAQARAEAAAHGLAWVDPPADGVPLAWAETLLRRITAPDRPVTKALVVDADNTLWGGVCGEVGPEHVDTSGPYREVQEFLRQQHRAGRALALCSRNNLDDLHAVFAAHPDMPLRLDDFVAVQATWGRKSEAVTVIAEDLGFATESLVFIDDSPAERTEVALQHPAMTVVDIPADPTAIPKALRATWQLALDGTTTEEDRARARLITQEAARRAAADRTPDLAAYLRELDLTVEIAPAATADVDRISQLAARTTQFNLLLRRHTPATVRQLLTGPGTALTVRVHDRFGDYGLVGFAFADADADAGILRVRDFFLSCRALGRNVEWRLLQVLGEQAATTGLSAVELRAASGPRNQPAHAFVRTAHTYFAATSPPIGALLDRARLVRADWREIEAPRPHPPRLQSSRAHATDRGHVRWPVSLDVAHRAAAVTQPGEQDALSTVFVAPETATERQITVVWEETLGVQPIGALDDLFALGCDSLTAAVICVRLHGAGVHLAIGDLLHQPTVRGCARLSRPIEPAPAAPADVGEQAVPSLGQARIWAAEHIQVHGNSQIIPTAHHITGPLDTGRLRHAFQTVVARHPALRTALDGSDGRLRCHLMPPSTFNLEFGDLTAHSAAGCDAAAEKAARAFFAARFDLQAGPMLRAAVLRLAPDDHLLLMAAHHSACDGWSMDVLHRDLSATYAAPDALETATPAPFADYQRSLADRIDRGDFRAAVEKIHHTLGPLPTTPVGPVLALPHETVPAPHHVRFALDLPLTQRVRAAAQSRATTPFHLYLAAYQLLLAAASDATTLISGSPVANRQDPAYTGTVGFFTNLVPIRTGIDWSSHLGAHLTAAIGASTRALRHSEVPYGLLTQAHPASGGLFDNLFTLQPPPSHPLTLHNCRVTPVEPAQWPQPYPLMLDLQEHPEGASALLRIDAQTHGPDRADWFTEAYPLVLHAVSSRPGLPLDHLRAALRPPHPAPPQLARRLPDLNGQETTRDV
ncbi:FkbM family methyltransferase [Streptomyces sp. NBC_01142]|uniref:FkbM family methyltransferase n=1 Tax=Streptomyces sp. NBC_01142 TaxID=2975865 RepID=UPI00225822A9|nr:FkbM family methyltransferase [Streptomyces sp. NBC_01142]MCX4826468.1 FkbM family methyltransferase [Streptomyces sp. NBC_01142]